MVKWSRTLLELADEAKCEVLEPIWVGAADNTVMGTQKALLHLRGKSVPQQFKSLSEEQDEIQIQSCQNRKEELELRGSDDPAGW